MPPPTTTTRRGGHGHVAQPVTRPHGTSRGDGPSLRPCGTRLSHTRPSATALLLVAHGLLGRVRRRLADAATAMEGARCGRLAAGTSAAVAAGRSAGRRRRPRPRRRRRPAARSTCTTQQALITTGRRVAPAAADVGATRYDVQVLVDEHGGHSPTSETETRRVRRVADARELTLRVPVDAFDDVMKALEELATLASTEPQSRGRHHRGDRRRRPDHGPGASLDRLRRFSGRPRTCATDPRSSPRSPGARPTWRRCERSRTTSRPDLAGHGHVHDERPPDPKATDRGRRRRLPRRPRRGWDGLQATSSLVVATVVGAVLPFAVSCSAARRPGVAARCAGCSAAAGAAPRSDTWRPARP